MNFLSKTSINSFWRNLIMQSTKSCCWWITQSHRAIARERDHHDHCPRREHICFLLWSRSLCILLCYIDCKHCDQHNHCSCHSVYFAFGYISLSLWKLHLIAIHNWIYVIHSYRIGNCFIWNGTKLITNKCWYYYLICKHFNYLRIIWSGTTLKAFLYQ